MKRILFLCLIFIGSTVFAQKFTKGTGVYRSDDGDSQEFIKQQLLYEGFKDIISKELDAMGLNKELFWKKYNDALDIEILALEKSLKEKYQIDNNPTSSQVQKFKKSFRYRKLIKTRNFGRIQNIISSYTLDKIYRSPKNPKYRRIKLEGAVKTDKLHALYYSLIKGKKSSDYGSLFINSEYILDGFNFSDIGIENPSVITDEVSKSWISWFSDEKRKPKNIANIEVLDADKKEKLQTYLKLSKGDLRSNIPEVFVNSLLLDIEIHIKLTVLNERFKEHKLEYFGNAYLKNLQTNLVVKTFKLNTVTKNVVVDEDINLPSLIANDVYRLALGEFNTVASTVKNINPMDSYMALPILGKINVYELNALKDLIVERGVKYSLQANLSDISRERSSLDLYFDGENSDIRNFLVSLESAKKDLKFQVVEDNGSFAVKFDKNASAKTIE